MAITPRHFQLAAAYPNSPEAQAIEADSCGAAQAEIWEEGGVIFTLRSGINSMGREELRGTVRFAVPPIPTEWGSAPRLGPIRQAVGQTPLSECYSSADGSAAYEIVNQKIHPKVPLDPAGFRRELQGIAVALVAMHSQRSSVEEAVRNGNDDTISRIGESSRRTAWKQHERLEQGEPFEEVIRDVARRSGYPLPATSEYPALGPIAPANPNTVPPRASPPPRNY